MVPGPLQCEHHCYITSRCRHSANTESLSVHKVSAFACHHSPRLWATPVVSQPSLWITLQIVRKCEVFPLWCELCSNPFLEEKKTLSRRSNPLPFSLQCLTWTLCQMSYTCSFQGWGRALSWLLKGAVGSRAAGMRFHCQLFGLIMPGGEGLHPLLCFSCWLPNFEPVPKQLPLKASERFGKESKGQC